MKAYRPFLTLLASFIVILLLSVNAKPGYTASRTIDGNPSDWTGTPSATVHTDAESGGEWIYTGAAGDRRTDAGMSDEADLTEVRLTADSTYLYFLFRLANITTANEVHIGIGVDTDQNSTDTGYTFVGDESNLTIGRAFMYAERVLSFHAAGSGNPEIEWYDGGSWYGVAGSQIAISTANDVVEARVPLTNLNGLTSSSNFILAVATFQNATFPTNPGWNNDVDSTDDFTTTDAVDVMGIPGQSGSSWARDLNDGNVYFGWWIQLQGSSNAPTAVVWDRLYHSECDQLKAFNCAASEHPAEQFVPSSGTTTRFLSARRYTTDDSSAPGGVTDVAAFDDESVDLYLMAHKGDLTDDGTYPRIRYYADSEAFADMSDVDDYTGSWNGTPATSYDIFKGTIPPLRPGDVYYYLSVEDDSGGGGTQDRHVCRSGGDNNWVNQSVYASGCPGDDYAYTVIDDDITGPTISNIVFTDNGSNDQVCADIYDVNTVSGDGDSGIFSALVRYDGTLSNVTGGSGTTAALSFVSGNTWCVSGLNFTNTFYRVEATNNDFDNSRTADRENSNSSVYCEGTCSGGGASPNGDIWWTEVYHNSRDSYYRSPFGAVPTSSAITLRLRVANNDLTGVDLMLYNSATGDHTYAMSQVVEANATYDWYEYTIPAADTTTTHTLYYKFKLKDSADEDWYIDDYAHNSYDHEDRYENGTGMMVDDGVASQYANNSFNAIVYSSAFTTPDWAKNVIIYQILPDRFRNGDSSNDNGWPFADVYGTTTHLHSSWNESVDDPRDSSSPYYQKWSADFYGGDLQGLIDELDYLQSIGVTAVYLNPVFASPSNHGYDTTDYLQISPRFGSNALFATLASEAQNRGIYLILDGVFNHTGSDSRYFDRFNRWQADGDADPSNTEPNSGACESNGSSYAAFYTFFGTSGPCQSGSRNYDSWWGYDSLPLLNENAAVKDYIFDFNNNDASPTAVIQYWYDQGADGWRFDVADEVSHSFWTQFRSQVKTNDGWDGPLYSEVWYEANPWLYGDQMDATMNYRYRKAVLGFLIDSTWSDNDNNSDQTMWQLSPSQFDYALNSIREDYPTSSWYTMMNLMGSHDTNRALFVLREQSSNLANAIAKMEMMAALQMTYPGAPTIYYGDEVGVGARDYNGYGEWGAGQTNGGIVQDDPYNRQSYPWSDQSGMLPAGLPNTSLRDTYQTLGLARGNYDVLRTGDVITLLTDDTNNLYAYARTDSNGAPNCAIAIFNRSTSSKNVTLDLTGLATCTGTFEDILNNGMDWTVSGSSLTVNNIAGLSSAVLLPAFDNPNTADSISTLPPARTVTGSSVDAIAAGGNATINATIYDVAGQTVSAGVTVSFTVLGGTGNLSSATATTNGSGVASVTYTDTGSETEEALVEATIQAPSGVTYRSSATIYVDYNAAVNDTRTTHTGIGPHTIDALSTLGVAVTKYGNGEPVVSLAQFVSNPCASNTGYYSKSSFVDVRLNGTTSVSSLLVTVRYTLVDDEANHKLLWCDSSGNWQQITGATVNTAANEVSFTVTSGTTPSLAQLTGTPLVVAGAGPTTIVMADSSVSVLSRWLWPSAAIVGLALLAGMALVWRKRN
jgi:glycosidase